MSCRDLLETVFLQVLFLIISLLGKFNIHWSLLPDHLLQWWLLNIILELYHSFYIYELAFHCKVGPFLCIYLLISVWTQGFVLLNWLWLVIIINWYFITASLKYTWHIMSHIYLKYIVWRVLMYVYSKKKKLITSVHVVEYISSPFFLLLNSILFF